MQPNPRITIDKDPELAAALVRAAAVNEPGTSEAALLRYLVLFGADNLPEPRVPPTPEELQRALKVWMRPKPRWVVEMVDRLKEFPEPHEPRSRSDSP